MTNVEFDSEYLWHPYASLKNTPARFVAKKAMGTRIETEEGFSLIDAVSSWWCVAHGHNNNEIVEAIQKQSKIMCHVMFGGFTHEPAIELGQRLVEFLPSGLNRIFFADSGSIAVECAAKMAVQFQHSIGQKNKNKLVALKGGYHGDTALAMSLSDPDGMHVLFKGIMSKHFFAERPNSRADGKWIDADFNSMEEIVQKHKNEIAAVICEPVFQGGNGMWLYHPNYLKKLRKLCNEQHILLIFDEIASGFFRTGKKFAMEHAGVLPDILCIGKALTGGAITLAACVASEFVAETITKSDISAFMHGPTYMANPLACAAGIASLKLFQKNDYRAQVSRIESCLKENLLPLKDLENVSDIRILGAIGCLELKAKPSAESILQIIRKTGVWLRPFCNYVYTMPPFITSNNEIEQICNAIKMIAQCMPDKNITNDAFHE